MAAKLKIVPPEPEREEPEIVLSEVVPQLAAAEAETKQLQRRLDEARRLLAIKRGVAFIRAEHVRREFS